MTLLSSSLPPLSDTADSPPGLNTDSAIGRRKRRRRETYRHSFVVSLKFPAEALQLGLGEIDSGILSLDDVSMLRYLATNNIIKSTATVCAPCTLSLNAG